MTDFETILLYKQYINTLQVTLNAYFEDQKEYVCCKEGCSHCCEKGIYPYTEVEFTYLLMGLLSLDTNKRQQVINRINSLKKDYEEQGKPERYLHRCPFLNEEGLCDLYEYRGIICRTFGILHINKKGKITMPFCESLGLNYSQVYDDEKEKFDMKKVKELGYKNYPYPFEISLDRLTDKEVFKDISFEFGEQKALIDWL